MNGVPDITADPATNEDFNGDGVVNIADCKGDQVINLTVEVPEVPGLVAEDFVALFPDVSQNLALMEISGFCSGYVVVINGPAFEIELVPGFDASGNSDDHSGLGHELPLVVEAFPVPPTVNGDTSTSGCQPADFQAFLDDFTITQNPRSITLITPTASGGFGADWVLFNYFPSGAGVPSFDGRTRYTLEHFNSPDNLLEIDRVNHIWNSDDSNNPATDKLVEIGGRVMGRYPAVIEENASLVRLTLLYDFNEAGELFSWAEDVLHFGTSAGGVGKSSINITTTVSGGGGGGSTTDSYFGCFPVRWEQRGGFRQDIKLKGFVIIECDTTMPGGP